MSLFTQSTWHVVGSQKCFMKEWMNKLFWLLASSCTSYRILNESINPSASVLPPGEWVSTPHRVVLRTKWGDAQCPSGNKCAFYSGDHWYHSALTGMLLGPGDVHRLRGRIKAWGALLHCQQRFQNSFWILGWSLFGMTEDAIGNVGGPWDCSQASHPSLIL